MYICHEIVKAHGGTLRAQSDLEVGTRFEASLPVMARMRASASVTVPSQN
ncbi:hypothetical protein [Cupriavidus campinensis]